VPYLDALERDGIYEDDLRLIIRMNHTDNPWFEESGLVSEQEDDKKMVKAGHMDAALYEHIWEGGFNDSVENALIIREWFDACVDAHEVLGFQPLGAKIAAHDPADQGSDSKGYACRHGSVVFNVLETYEGTVNDGGHWAAQLAIDDEATDFKWDADGLGAGLGEQMSYDLEAKGITLGTFKGSQSPDYKEMVYKPAVKEGIHNQLKNKEVFKNKRAQYYFELRDRIYRTYRAVKFNEYADPDTLISFSSQIPLLSKLRSELCRIPKKPNRNGLNELYSKDEMRSRLKIPSPNLADSVMMTMRYVPVTVQHQHRHVHIPSPIPVMGRR
jgi:phage terminase large subunit